MATRREQHFVFSIIELMRIEKAVKKIMSDNFSASSPYVAKINSLRPALHMYYLC